MDIARITCYLEELDEGQYRHRFFAVGYLVLDLNGSFLDHLVQLISNLFFVSSRLFDEKVLSIIYGIGKDFIYRLHHGYAGSIQWVFNIISQNEPALIQLLVRVDGCEFRLPCIILFTAIIRFPINTSSRARGLSSS